MSGIRLYQFPVSHYCEKVRWALDYKGLGYQAVNMIPGLHIKKMKKLSGQTSVPLLLHNDQLLSGSANIISYLDQQFPEHLLTPTEAQLQQQALSWEQRLDQQAGVDVRLWCYHHLLQRPEQMTALLAAGRPIYWRWLLKGIYPKLNDGMRHWMKINADSAAAAERRMQATLTDLRAAYSQSHFLVGERLSRADITACSLFAMLFQPKEYGVRWPRPAQLPEAMRHWLEDNDTLLEPLRLRYAQYRPVRHIKTGG